MKKNQIKNMVLLGLFVVLAPLILLGVTYLGNTISGKGKVAVQTIVEQKATVPTETKTQQTTDVPKTNDNKVESSTNSSTTNENNSQQTATNRAVAGQNYTVQLGDTLFTIASTAYGEANSQKGIEKIRETNNMQNDNLVEGQTLQIPNL